MNTPGGTPGGRFKGVDYFNGGLFAEPARVELYPDELAQLRQAAKARLVQGPAGNLRHALRALDWTRTSGTPSAPTSPARSTS